MAMKLYEILSGGLTPEEHRVKSKSEAKQQRVDAKADSNYLTKDPSTLKERREDILPYLEFATGVQGWGERGEEPNLNDLLWTLPMLAGTGVGAAKAVKHTVSGGTPISRLIANSIEPTAYDSKWHELKRVLTNPKVLKEAVIDDIPQYKLFDNAEDRLFAWRKKLGLGKPNEKYNQVLDMVQYNAAQRAKKKIKTLDKGDRRIPHLKKIVDDYNQNNPIDKIWNKFGTHVEDGKTYYHYKNPNDYFSIRDGDRWVNKKHGLFGGWSSKQKMKGSKEFGGVLREDYYDNWDFARNTSLSKRMKTPLKRLLQGDVKGFVKRELEKLPVSFQRGLAEALLNPLEFKGTAKKIYRRPNKEQLEAKKLIKSYFDDGRQVEKVGRKVFIP